MPGTAVCMSPRRAIAVISRSQRRRKDHPCDDARTSQSKTPTRAVNSSGLRPMAKYVPQPTNSDSVVKMATASIGA